MAEYILLHIEAKHILEAEIRKVNGSRSPETDHPVALAMRDTYPGIEEAEIHMTLTETVLCAVWSPEMPRMKLTVRHSGKVQKYIERWNRRGLAKPAKFYVRQEELEVA